MQLHADFTQRAAVHAAQLPWAPSPVAGIERRMLDRIGSEVARATSIVRYAPESVFTPHTHGGGEEFLVLDGVFSDEHGDFPAGSYIRNPPTSRHTPGSKDGCIIYVKLWQFDSTDRTALRMDTTTLLYQNVATRPNVTLAQIYQDQGENVRLEKWTGDADITLADVGGIEILVLDGSFTENGEVFSHQSWLRLPIDATLRATAGKEGCRVLIKTGHLAVFQSVPALV